MGLKMMGIRGVTGNHGNGNERVKITMMGMRGLKMKIKGLKVLLIKG